MKYLLFILITLVGTTAYADYPAGYYRAQPNNFGGYRYYQNNKPIGYSSRSYSGSISYYNNQNRMVGRAYPANRGSGYIYRGVK
jgi:hypothetical protein